MKSDVGERKRKACCCGAENAAEDIYLLTRSVREKEENICLVLRSMLETNSRQCME